MKTTQTKTYQDAKQDALKLGKFLFAHWVTVQRKKSFHYELLDSAQAVGEAVSFWIENPVKGNQFMLGLDPSGKLVPNSRIEISF